MSDAYPQNDPDRAGGLISDAKGEFVESEAGGAFDPRAFGGGSGTGGESRDSDVPERPDEPAAADEERRPPVNDERMSSPGAEIDKAG